jgi:hypothetical protein
LRGNILSLTTTPTLETIVEKPFVTNELCDACGGSVKARHVAFKDEARLFFCGHHARANNEKLTNQGFEINPSNLDY